MKSLQNEKQQKSLALFMQYERLVGKVWFDRFRWFVEEKEDLMQCGRLGLWKSCITYNENKETKFMSYAYKCISNEMGMYIKKEMKHWKNSTSYIVKLEDGTTKNVLELIENGQYEQMVAQAEFSIIIKNAKYKDDLNRMYQGHTYSEISRQKGLTIEAIRNRVLKEREKIYDKSAERSI